MHRTLLVLVAATACGATSPAGSTSPPISNQPPPTAPAVPPGYKTLRGPEPCPDPAACGITQLREVDASGVRRIGVVVKGLNTTLAIETAAGWFFEAWQERGPRLASHHQPHGRGYDLAATRVDNDGTVIVRLIDSQSVFYPGQGPAGSSHTTWFDRRCRVAGGQAYCAAPQRIASQACHRPSIDAERTCTGSKPE